MIYNWIFSFNSIPRFLTLHSSWDEISGGVLKEFRMLSLARLKRIVWISLKNAEKCSKTMPRWAQKNARKVCPKTARKIHQSKMLKKILQKSPKNHVKVSQKFMLKTPKIKPKNKRNFCQNYLKIVQKSDKKFPKIM